MLVFRQSGLFTKDSDLHMNRLMAEEKVPEKLLEKVQEKEQQKVQEPVKVQQQALVRQPQVLLKELKQLRRLKE